MRIRENDQHTLFASYLGYITQAIVNNLAPLLFLTFQKEYQLSLSQIASLITVNFGVQLLVDLLAAKFVDRIGYRIAIVSAHILCGLGLIGLGILPALFANPYVGLFLAISIYAIGGGLIEVLISPIVEACNTEQKAASMSILHSFYCWGHVAVVILSTIYFQVFGIGGWKLLTCLWAVIPLLNSIYFTQVPIRSLTEVHESFSIRKLFSMKLFWILLVLMVCSGAAELAMSQWVSAFAESGLKVSKTVGDLAGPCLFAILMGTARVIYAKYSKRVDLHLFILCSSILCIFSYGLAVFAPHPVLSLIGCGLCGLSVGILWPGTFSIAAARCPMGGTALFALLALAGDLGCSAGPALVGTVSEAAGDLRAGLLIAIIFPVLLVAGIIYLKKAKLNA